MKKIALFLLQIIFAINFSLAQTNTFPSSGNVGIGTLVPGSHLEVFELSDSKPNNMIAPTASVLKLSRVGTSNYSYYESAKFRIGHGGPSVWGSQLDLFINGGSNQSNVPDRQAMTWLYNGNVGIGTTSPNYRLEINGNLGGRGGMGNGSMGQYYEIVPYEIATDNNAGWTGTMLGVRSGGMNSSSIPVTQNIPANAPQYQQAWAMTFSTDRYQTNGSAFSLWTGDATTAGTPMAEIFRIKSNGYVGIGTTNPDQKPTVNGTIHAKQVNVDVNIPVPDYVFEKNYPLKPLAEVKKYVDANKHLPEIPTATVMEKSGINVTELDIQLLKKVEELTLYLIEKDKQIRDQKGVSRGLKTEIAELKKQVSLLITAKNKSTNN